MFPVSEASPPFTCPPFLPSNEPLSPVIQDVLSILDQPPNFNNDDFEIPIYSQFNE